ncbi:hypothetical protein HBI56_077820 [Parastagonospora nodorum]|uniref:Uncharacterized protein n=2 Tax=Phaeosphaeria nodorum (strain SN15 / ATCC MYA-4574 / FGSC 10173) TaxID=321614 RepID=A0A7U2EWU3_PHANO|nr:hypothetical protein SNOG_07450 [Parastagonospora nodorum SN15]KAH3910260.1 hypothetical protein HBH56_149360 [Parastagonospora nodorum]EAT84916.1 hypothetical protein SNOG_07450 [Parastagonospora nodorum SN15]KAH3928561.1 hypothetical protein HBH54_135260 [Parastagonospora nodorum]KAH3945996.1 hypothetical protein HBH53_136810 [Parastagonospora nodorum]KAH3983833.1 hypothetical protein HBH52_063200 [Parastagonospora nodorum]
MSESSNPTTINATSKHDCGRTDQQTPGQKSKAASPRVAVLLQWKDREMSDDLAELMVCDSKTKADPARNDVDMEDV